MKKILLILICSIMLAACNKNPSDNITVTITSTKPIDTFTVIDNGITYIDTQSVIHGAGANIVFQKTSSGAIFLMQTSPNTRFPILVQIESVPGPLNGIGVFKLSPIDSSLTNQNAYIETYNGGEAYTVDSVIINLTTFSSASVTGSYQIWLSNIAGSKTVTGTIKCFHPIIEL